jgi:hypothetical protein
VDRLFNTMDRNPGKTIGCIMLIRKVGGLSVKAMEQFGVVYRQGYYS